MQEKEQLLSKAKNKQSEAAADGLAITVYTDPLCCWSWAMRPVWKEFLQEVPTAEVSYRMAGLLPSWRHFADSVNAISKPVQMGPEWMHARVVSGAEIDDRIWFSDPPGSSWPACIAVKAAGLQSREAGDRYFELLQQAVMTERRNIARVGILLEIAGRLSVKYTGFDMERFASDLTGAVPRELFRRDMQEWKYLGVGRLPAIILKNGQGRGVIISGYQTLQSLKEAGGSLSIF